MPEQPNDDGLVPPLKVMRKRLNGVYSAEGLAGPTRRYVLIVAMLVGLASLPTLAAITAGSSELDDGRSGAMDVPFLPPASAGPVRIRPPDAVDPPGTRPAPAAAGPSRSGPGIARGEAQRRKTRPRVVQVSPGRGYGDSARGSGQGTGSGADRGRGSGAGSRPGVAHGAGSDSRPGSRPASGSGSDHGSVGPDPAPSQHDPAQHDPAQHDPAQHDPAQHDPAQHDPVGRDSAPDHPDVPASSPHPAPGWRLPSPPSGWPVVPDPPDSTDGPPDRSHHSPCEDAHPSGRREGRRQTITVHNEATGQRRSDSRRRPAVTERPHNVRSARGADRTHNSHRHHPGGTNRGDGVPTAIRAHHGSHLADRGHDPDDRTGALHRSSRMGRHHADPYQDHQNRW